ncbi:hypothetical protein GCM10028804_16100 [Larkinella terrae]
MPFRVHMADFNISQLGRRGPFHHGRNESMGRLSDTVNKDPVTGLDYRYGLFRTDDGNLMHTMETD